MLPYSDNVKQLLCTPYMLNQGKQDKNVNKYEI